MKKILNLLRFDKPYFKLDLKMKLSILLLMTSIFMMQANDTYSQKTKISLNLDKMKVSDVIDKIENETQFRFVYNIKSVDLDNKVSINVKNEKKPPKRFRNRLYNVKFCRNDNKKTNYK